jgi:hypothetical protein
VAASTQNQALSALLFLYREVLQADLPWMDGVVHAKRPKHVPVVLAPFKADKQRQIQTTGLHPRPGAQQLHLPSWKIPLQQWQPLHHQGQDAPQVHRRLA